MNRQNRKKMDRAQTLYQKRKGTKKQYRAAMRKNRCTAFMDKKLGTLTHASGKDYDRNRSKEELRREIQRDRASDG